MRVQITTKLKISRLTLSKLKKASRRQSAKDMWFAKAHRGANSLRVGHSAGVEADREGEFTFTMRWFLTDSDPPPEMGNIDSLMKILGPTVGEREVDVSAEFVFSPAHMASVFKPFDLGEQSQIIDEIVGFTGVKKDTQGKILYKMEISVTNETIENKLSFRQTIKLSDDMVISLIETASKISALAIKSKEGR